MRQTKLKKVILSIILSFMLVTMNFMNFNCISTISATINYGDVSESGKVELSDAQLTLKAALKVALNIIDLSGSASTQIPSNSDMTNAKYILNTNTLKFHYPSCSSVEAMNEENKESYSGTKVELIAKGYSPCGRCKP